MAGALRIPAVRAPADLAATIEVALDPEAGLPRRIVAVRALAARDDDEAFSVLERIVRSDEAPEVLRAEAAEALGRSPHGAAPALLRELFDAAPPRVAAGAARGLAEEGEPAALDLLIDALHDPTRALAVREATAQALGTLDEARAHEALRELFRETEDETLAASVLEGLAAQDPARVEPFFRELLASELPLERRLEAVEALEDGAAGVAALLLDTATRAEEPEIRSAGVRALVGADDPQVPRALLDLLPEEADPTVRADLYHALAFDVESLAAVDEGALLAEVVGEPTARARIEGARLVARLAAGTGTPELARAFDRDLVPWLETSAQAGGDPYERMGAIDALGFAGTAASRDALHRLARSASPAVARAASRALERRR